MIKVKTHTEVKGQDKVDRLLKKIGDLKNAYVTVGVHEDAGRYTKGSNPPTVVEVALWNEFGTRTTPQRSFFGSTLSENESRIAAYMDQMIDNILDKDWSVEKALESLGLFVQTLIQNKIKSNVPPEYGTGRGGNTPEDVSRLQEAKRRRTGHTNTLRDTELLLRSIGFKVNLR